MRLLIADENDERRATLAREARRLGWHALPCATGAAARDAARTVAVDLVLLSDQLPDETAAQLRQFLAPRPCAALPATLGELRDALAPPAADAATVDFNRLKEAAGDDPDGARALLDLLESQAAEHGAALTAAVGAGDAPALRRAAHTWRGGSAACGLLDLAARLQALETSGTSGLPADAAAQLAACVAAAADGLQALRTALAEWEKSRRGAA